MNEAQTLAYVQAAAVAVGLPLDDAQAARVATHLQRTAAMAALLDAFPLQDEDEVVEIFCPAPFIPAST
ncbi:DUF4089 domain-containing protein [Hydrogenophaga sp.]|uniref:DUF4089 domain-containing protein n=1 Tax=Hydrogenophaga sp. TaxID=1904254 RepID=UPI003F70632E